LKCSLRKEAVMSRFGELLREARRRVGLTQKELGKNVDVSDAYICKMERGVFPPPSREVALKLAEALGIKKKAREWVDFLLEAGVATKEDMEGFNLQAISTPLPTTANRSMEPPDISFGAGAEEVERLVASGDYSETEEEEVWAAVIELIQRFNALKAMQRATRKEG
jgi:transcriptional regulator with XRE-family HTH domain